MQFYPDIPIVDNDEILFAKVERGDMAAFTEIYHGCHKLLYVMSYRYLMDTRKWRKMQCNMSLLAFGISYGTPCEIQPEKLLGDNDQEPYFECDY